MPKNISAVLKLAVGILLLPLVYSFTLSFIEEFNSAGRGLAFYFWAGVVSFTVFYIFIYQPEMIYDYGQNAVARIFSFYKPLSKAAAYFLPAYAVAIFIIYGLFAAAGKIEGATRAFFLLMAGFASAMHLVFVARSAGGGKGDLFKADYIFLVSSVYIAVLILLGFLLSLAVKGFSFFDFFGASFRGSVGIFNIIFNKVG